LWDRAENWPQACLNLSTCFLIVFWPSNNFYFFSGLRLSTTVYLVQAVVWSLSYNRPPDIQPKCCCQKSPFFGFFVCNQILFFGLPIILLGSYLSGKPRSLLFQHLFTILKATQSSGPSVLLHASRPM
jgi:hypothetical protein